MSQFYANPNPIYQPAMRLISSISNANPAVITTTFNHQYVSGIIVRLDVPSYLGMPQADQQVVTILTILGPTSFAVDMDSSFYEPFSIPGEIPAHANMTAMVVPIGEVNRSLAAATVNILPYNSIPS